MTTPDPVTPPESPDPPLPRPAGAPVRTASDEVAPGLRDWHAVIVLVAAVGFCFRRILLGSEFLGEDFLMQVFPFRSFAAVTLAQGQLPLWNPYAFAGMPFQADIQSAVFYLPHLLLTPFVHDGMLSFRALEAMLIAHFALGAVGMYFLARALDLERPYALFAGLAYGLSGFMIVHAIHPGFVEQAAWLPVIMWLLHRAMTRRSVRAAVAAGVTAGHAVFAGAPQITLYVFMLGGALAAFVFGAGIRRVGWRASLPAPALALLATALAVGVAAIQLIPTMELAPLSERDTLSFEAAQSGRLTWAQALTAVIPRFFGVYGATEKFYWGPGTYGVYWETCFYWGITTLLAAAAAVSSLRRDARVAFLVAVVLVSFLLAVGDRFVLHRVFFTIVPGFSMFRVPARIMLLATCAMALLAGFGLRAAVTRARTAPRAVEHGLIGVMSAMVGLWLTVRAGWLVPATHERIGEIHALVRHESLIALALVGMVTAIGFGVTRRLLTPTVAVAALLALQLGDMARFGAGQHAGKLDAEAHFHTRLAPLLPVVRQLQRESQQDLFRVTVREGGLLMLDRNQGMVDRLHSIDGYSPLRLRRLVPPAPDRERTLDLLNTRYRVRADSAAGTIRMQEAPTYLPRAFVVPADTVIADDSAAAAFMRRPAFDPRRVVVLAEPLPVDAATAADTGSAPIDAVAGTGIYDVNAFQVEVTTPRAGVLVFSEIHYPGWIASVDGVETPIVRANWNLRAIAIPAGRHEVAMRFAPVTFRIGAWISALTLLVAGGAWLLSRNRF